MNVVIISFEIVILLYLKEKMKTKKQKIKQQIMATIVAFFMFIMIFGSFDVLDINAATVVNMNLIQNVVSGALAIECMQNLVFPDINVGVAANSEGNMTVFNVRDYRGTGAGWTVAAVSNNLTLNTGAAGINNFSNAVIAMLPQRGTIIGLEGSSTTGVYRGADLFLTASRNLISANAGNGMGNYRLNNTIFNVVYNGRYDQLQGRYEAIVTFTAT